MCILFSCSSVSGSLLFRPGQAPYKGPGKLFLPSTGWTHGSGALNGARCVLDFHVCFSVIVSFLSHEKESMADGISQALYLTTSQRDLTIPPFSPSGRIRWAKQRPRVITWWPRVAMGITGLWREGLGRWSPRYPRQFIVLINVPVQPLR